MCMYKLYCRAAERLSKLNKSMNLFFAYAVLHPSAIYVQTGLAGQIAHPHLVQLLLFDFTLKPT